MITIHDRAKPPILYVCQAMRIQNKRKFTLILFVLISAICFAQTTPPPPPAETLPIDGGVLIGAFMAVCYGVKKLLKKN